MTEDLPVFLPPEQGFVLVELAGVDLAPGVYQFNDGLVPYDVIKLTGALPPENFPVVPDWSQNICNGDRLRIIKKDREIAVLQRSWMSTSHRIALGILLHPDRMSRENWLALPSVGAALAEEIEIDRHKNGGFDTFEGLIRVKGIGEKRLENSKIFLKSM